MTTASLTAHAPLRVFDGFGRAVKAASRCLEPRDAGELAAMMRRASEEGVPIALRGSGRSYGDAALSDGGVVIDVRKMNRALSWDPREGLLTAESGLTIEGVWRRVLPDHYWPHVVPGTMFPTLAGSLSMNIHGKNNFRQGSFGEHVAWFELVTPAGEVLRCDRESNADLFHAAIGGFGVLGAITKVALRVKPVESGLLRVEPLVTRDLDEMFDVFGERLPVSDYLVGWVDCLAGGAALGRGQIHQANYLSADETPDVEASFYTENQTLPTTIFGFPKSALWRFMRPFINDLGTRLVNSAKYLASRLTHQKPFLQSHVAFAFLLDYVPNWRLSYGPGGLIQYQIFVPKETARETMKAVLAHCQRRGLPSYLGVFKRHRPDPFLLTHALDGYSLAMDFRVTRSNRDRLWAMTRELTDLVLDAGGKFYFAKDSVLRPGDARRAFGDDRLERFFALRDRVDPAGILGTDLARRVFPDRFPRA